MTSGRSDLIDIDVDLHAETAKAWCVSVGHEDKVWIPKSQGELERKSGLSAHVLTIPEWLAVQRGLV